MLWVELHGWHESDLFCSCRAEVICTDLNQVIPLIESNKSINNDLISGSLTVEELKW